MAGVATSSESAPVQRDVTVAVPAGNESQIVPARLQTRTEANQALIANAQRMEQARAAATPIPPETVAKAQELREMSATIPSEYCDDKGMPKTVGGWEVLFAKFFMLTHPVMKLREFLNGGKPYLNPQNSEQVMYNKHMQVLKLDKYHRKKDEYFPEQKEANNSKSYQVQGAVPVAA